MSLLKCNSRSNSSVESLKTSLVLFTLPYQTRASWSIHGVQKLKALETDTLARREACRRDGIEGSVITPHPLNFHKRPLSDRRRQYVNSTYPECRQLVAFFSSQIYTGCICTWFLIAFDESLWLLDSRNVFFRYFVIIFEKRESFMFTSNFYVISRVFY